MKVCLAGTNIDKEVVKNNLPKFVLESFYTIKDWQTPFIKECELFLLDSGAFSFMGSAKKGKQITLKEIDEYLDRYIEFINKYDVKYFFELDIDVIFGYETVLKLRKKLEEKTGKKCIPVFHINRGIEEWRKMIKEYDYVAIGCSGMNDSKWTKNTNILKKMIKEARQNNCKVHGLGYTRGNIQGMGFYSTDSTSWLSGGRFGVLFLFKNGKLHKIKRDNARLKDYKKVLTHNLNEWKKYQEWLRRY